MTASLPAASVGMGHREGTAAPCAGSDVNLRLARGAEPFLLDGRPALFSEASQRIFDLNDTAAIIMAALTEPVPLDAFRARFSQCFAGGARELDHQIVAWNDAGIVDAEISLDRSANRSTHAIALPLDRFACSLNFDDNAFGQSLAAPYAHLSRFDSGRTVPLTVTQSEQLAVLSVDGQCAQIVAVEDAGTALRNALTRIVLREVQAISFHAACLVTDEGAVLFLGSPGAGKSTLAACLGAAGLTLAGDDIVMFDPRLRAVRAVPFPLTVKSGGAKVIAPLYPSIDRIPELRRRDGQNVRYLPMRQSPDPRWLPVRAIVGLCRHDGHGAEALSHWPKTDCLRALMSEAWSPSGRCSATELASLRGLVQDAETMHLHYSSAPEAAKRFGRQFAR